MDNRGQRWELSIEEDYLYPIIQIRTRDSVVEEVQILEVGTNRVIRKGYPEPEEFLWGGSFWADGYFAETVGQVKEDVGWNYMRDYQVP